MLVDASPVGCCPPPPWENLAALHEGAEIDYALVQRRVEGWVQFVSHSVHTRSELRIAVAETLFGNGMDGSSKFLDDR